MNLDRRLVWALRALLAALIFGLLYRVIGRDSFADAFSRTNWHWLPLLYLVAAMGIVVNAHVLRYLLRCGGLVVPLHRVLLAKSLGSFYALILPGDFFAGAAKWADLSAATGNKARVLSSLVLTKISLAVPPLVVGSIALAMHNPLRKTSLMIASAATAILVISMTALVLYPPTGRRFDAMMSSLLRRMPARLQPVGQRLLASVVVFQQLRPADYVIVLGLSFCVFALSIVSMHVATIAVGVFVPLTALFWVNLILFVARLLPLTIGNLGVRESVLVLAFGLYGVPAASAVLVGLLMFSSLVFVGLTGGAYQLALASGWIAWRTNTDTETDRASPGGPRDSGRS